MLGARLGWRVRRFDKDGAKDGAFTRMNVYCLKIIPRCGAVRKSARSIIVALTVIFAAWISPLA